MKRAARLALSAALLWAIWLGWRPAPPPLPADIAVVTSREEAGRLAHGRAFAVEGELQPAGRQVERTWRGRFVYRRADWRKDDMGARVLHLAEDVRPGVVLRGGGGAWPLPARSYGLARAPRIPPSPRFAWNQENAGFRPGDPAVALGMVDAGGTPHIRELAVGPMEAYRRRAARAEGSRRLLIGAIRALLTLFVAAYAASALAGTPPAAEG